MIPVAGGAGLTPRPLVLVRGAGDIASGVIVRLARSGFLVAALEVERPTAIRRMVALSECMYDGRAEVEGVRAHRVGSVEELLASVAPLRVPVLADPEAETLSAIAPCALVDAILAKRNLGTRIERAPIVVALGPGFIAGVDAHAVVETNRGHDLGRVILSGAAQADTGVPGMIGGYGGERVVRAPIAGRVETLCALGSLVRRGEPILAVEGDGARAVVLAPLDGRLRGLIRGGSEVAVGFKVADVDPRGDAVDAATISDKARAIAGGVLEALLMRGAAWALGAVDTQGRARDTEVP